MIPAAGRQCCFGISFDACSNNRNSTGKKAYIQEPPILIHTHLSEHGLIRIAVHCQVGGDEADLTQRALETLMALGYNELAMIDGGYSSWTKVFRKRICMRPGHPTATSIFYLFVVAEGLILMILG